MAKNQHTPKWTKEHLISALDEVNNGAPKRKTAEKYGIPWGTFSDKLSGRRKMEDHSKTVLSEEEEGEIVVYLKTMSVRGFGKTKAELLAVVKNYLDQKGRKTQWENNMPSTQWFRLFRKRHPEIVFRKPQLLGKQRALVSKRDILDWFADFSRTMKGIDASILLEPERIYNCDESGFSLNASSGRILSSLETKFVYQVGSEAKTLITALVCCSAAGHFTWPMLIYPGTQFRGFKPQEVFEQSFIGRSENGWINQNLFYEWLKMVFVPQIAHVKKPLLLLVDGHISHQSLQTSTLCTENNIVLYCLPPHSSHILQPLDVGVFKTMKTEWKLAVKRQNETEIVTKRTFAKTFKDAYERTVVKPLTEKAFKACGIYLLDPDNIEWSKILPRSDELDVSTSTPPVAQSPAISAPGTPSSASQVMASPAAHSTPQPSVTSVHGTSSTSAAPSPSASGTSAGPTLSVAQSPVVSATGTTSVPPDAQFSNASSSRATLEINSAQSNHCPDGYTDPTSTLRKFAMISAQIGDATLNLYYTRLVEGYDCNIDPLYNLWKTYHTELVSLLARSSSQDKQEKDSAATSSSARNPLAISTVKKGTKRVKALKLPSLISSPDFRNMLLQKEADEKAEEERKKQRKIDMEEKKRAKAKEEELKKAKREEKRKEREEKKRLKETEVQLRKEERKTKLEERKKAKNVAGKKKQKNKVSRKLYETDSDTSVDESAMVLDDNSSDEYEVDCASDKSTVSNEDVLDPGSTTAKDTETDTRRREENGSDRLDSENLNDSLSQYIVARPQGQPGNESTNTTERNLWLDLAVESIGSISPSLHMLE